MGTEELLFFHLGTLFFFLQIGGALPTVASLRGSRKMQRQFGITARLGAEELQPKRAGHSELAANAAQTGRDGREAEAWLSVRVLRPCCLLAAGPGASPTFTAQHR